MLTMIPATKKVEVGVNGFHFMRVFVLRCFVSFSFPEEAYLTARMFLDSG